METLLSFATILGGIAAIGYFSDKYRFWEIFIDKPVDGWKAKINDIIGDAKIYGQVINEPQIQLVGPYKLTEDQETEASKIRNNLITNDPHAMVLEEPNLQLLPLIFKTETLDYAQLEVLRKSNSHNFILSANSVIVCREKRVLIVHHRSEKSRTYWDCLHTIGGAYQPPIFQKEGDRNSLVRTAHREADEEIQASILTDDIPPMILVLEPSTKFIQLVFLGANISAKQCDNLIPNWEGVGLVKISFDELESLLTAPIKRTDADGRQREINWVPTGKAHVLAWLAFGAPNAGVNATFGGLSPKTLFKKIIREIV